MVATVVGGLGCDRTPEPVGPGLLQDVYLSADALDGVVEVGESTQLTAIAHIDDGVVNRTEDCTFVLTDDKVASVDPKGMLTGLKPGQVTITAKLRSVQSDPLSLEVVAPAAP